MNQHYVPRVYLKHFAIHRGGAFYVDAFEISKKRMFNTNITGICVERDLYTLDDHSKISENPLIIEKLYAEGFEPMYARVHELLTNDSITIISNFQRIEILIAVFQFYGRNPQMKNNAIEHHQNECTRKYEQAIKNTEKGISHMDEDFSFREFSLEEILRFISDKINTNYKEKHIYGISEIGSFHEYGKLEVIKARDGNGFLTSDNPLLINNLAKDEHNILDRLTEFTLPLTPQYALRIYHDKAQPLNSIRRISVPNGDAYTLNSGLEKTCSRFLIGNKQSFDLYFKMGEMINSDPEKIKVDVLRQVLTLYEKDPARFSDALGPEGSMQLIKEYITKFDKGEASIEDEYRLQLRINLESLEIKRNASS